MPAHRVLSDEQSKILLDYMEAHPDFAKGIVPCMTGPTGKYEINARWKNLACSLNAVGSGCKKTYNQWREYWNHAKYSARKKACTIRKQLKGLMKGEQVKRLLVLTDSEKRVLASVGIPLPGLPLVKSQPDTTAPNGLPPDSPPLAESPPISSPPNSPLPDGSSPETSTEVKSASGSSCSGSPVHDRSTKTWGRASKRKAAYESATSTTRAFSTPNGSTPKKRFRHVAPPAPEWVRNIEERRIAVEERSARALQGIQANTEFCASALQGIHIAQERMNRTLQGIQAALEASARALQGRCS